MIWGDDNRWGWGNANVRYLTQIAGEPGLLIFPLESEPVLIERIPNAVLGWGAAQRWISNMTANLRPDHVVDELKGLRLDRGRIGVVGTSGLRMSSAPNTIPFNTHSQIVKMLPEATFVDMSPLMEEVRMIKSDEELEFLTKAGDVSYKMWEGLVNEARPGKTEHDLLASMMDAMVRNEGDPNSFILLDSGNPPMLGPGGRSSPPSSRKLQKGDLITTEYHGNYGGYLHAHEHTVSLGEPREEFRKVDKVSQQVFDYMLDTFRPGVLMKDGLKGARKIVKDAGLTYVELGIHGHGLGSGEFPTSIYGDDEEWIFQKSFASQALAQGRIYPLEFQENMVFGTNIDISNPTFDRRATLMCGDTIVISKNGGRKLSKIPLELSVVPA
jgi:Xaa-Pro aminopeptidase